MIDSMSVLSPGNKNDAAVSLEKQSKDDAELELASGCPELVTWAKGGGPGAPEKFTLYIEQRRPRFSLCEITQR